MLRTRDILAVFLAVWLVRLAWNEDQESLSANLHLAFYAHANAFSELDIDGDGTNEALVVASSSSESAWKLEILDLKPIHKRKHNVMTMAPFRPKTLLESAAIQTTATPLKLATGQILIKKHVAPKLKIDKESEGKDFTDRTRHYFCGLDWHDASSRCEKPCPGGTPSECPDGHKCYADTACDALAVEKEEAGDDKGYQLTPGGGLPSIVSLWSDGTVKLHSVTSTEGAKTLELKEMWSQTVQLGLDEYDIFILGDEDLSEGGKSLGQNGIVVLGGTKRPNSMVQAMDSMSGEVLWNSREVTLANAQQTQKAEEQTPSERGSTSVARRRSRLLAGNEKVQDSGLPNCWVAYRHSLMEHALPYTYWGPSDSKWLATHLDRTPKHKKSKHHRKWHHKHAKPIFGRPNVLLSHTKGGIQVRSLKNGRPLCHLSLMDHILYADLNHDGTLDQLQAVTGEQTDQNNEWVQALAEQVVSDKEELKDFKRMTTSDRLCHVMALSGLPAREELFTASLCNGHFARERGDHASVELSSAPPAVTNGGDHVVVALSNGMVSKFHSNGKRVWQTHGQILDPDFPTWRGRGNVALTANLPIGKTPFAKAPILLIGENGMALLSNAKGAIMASAVFPQASQTRPVLVDVSGDGTSDVLVATKDAVWGYVVVVQTGASVLFRILVGLLFLGIALALLRNRFSSQNGRTGDRRSTDG